MVECLPGGEVSGFMHDEARVGDVLELRGPIGGWFTWTGEVPAVAVGRRLRRGAARRDDALRRAGSAWSTCSAWSPSARTLDALPYADELREYGALVALTRENLDGRVAAPPYPEEVGPARRGRRACLRLRLGRVRVVRRSGCSASPACAADAIRVEQFGASG